MAKREKREYKDGREPIQIRVAPELKARVVAAAKKNRRSVTAEIELVLQREYGKRPKLDLTSREDDKS